MTSKGLGCGGHQPHFPTCLGALVDLMEKYLREHNETHKNDTDNTVKDVVSYSNSDEYKKNPASYVEDKVLTEHPEVFQEAHK